MTKTIATLPGWLMFIILMVPCFLSSHFPPPLSSFIVLVVVIPWLYSLGAEAQEIIPDEFRSPFNRFKYALLYFAAYALVGSKLLANEDIALYVAPFHLLAMACIFYCFHFIAKTIRSIELNRQATFGDWLAVFFALWFFPIGVWFIQKKMKRILVTNNQ